MRAKKLSKQMFSLYNTEGNEQCLTLVGAGDGNMKNGTKSTKPQLKPEPNLEPNPNLPETKLGPKFGPKNHKIEPEPKPPDILKTQRKRVKKAGRPSLKFSFENDNSTLMTLWKKWGLTMITQDNKTSRETQAVTGSCQAVKLSAGIQATESRKRPRGQEIFSSSDL